MEVAYQRECGGMLVSECHVEHHFPDYLGDMKKVLSSSARVVPAGKFIGNEEVQFGGSVRFDVWYLDGENRLSHESFSADYEFSCPCNGEAVDGVAYVSVSSFSLRPIGPRRISGKATLEAAVCLRKKDAYVCENEGEDTILHTAPRELSVGYRCFSSPMEREYGEEIAVPAAYIGAEILHSEGSLQIERVEAKENAVLVSGNYSVAVVLGAEGLPPIRLSGGYPVEEEIALSECTADMCATANGFFISLTCNLKEGEEPMLAFHGICEFSACAEKNLSVSVVEDAFLEGGSVCTSEILAYDTFGTASMLCRKVDLVLSAEDGDGATDAIFHTTVHLKKQSYTAKETEIRYTAEAEVCALGYAVCEDGGVRYGSHRATAPISLSLPLDAPIPEGGKLLVMASAGACEGRIEEDCLHVGITLGFCVQSRTEQEMQCVRRVCPTPSEKESFAPKYAVYYPTPQDTLWSIAKRYGVSPAAIAAVNRLSAPTAGSGEDLPAFLIVDQRKRVL